MIWVVNAEKFKDRFQIRSSVTAQLRGLKLEEAQERQKLENFVVQYETDELKRLSKLQSEVESLRRSKVQFESKLAKIYAMDAQEIERLADSVLNQITNSAYELNEHSYELKRTVPADLKDKLQQLKSKTQNTSIEIEKANRKIAEIEALPDSDIILGHKLVHHSRINEANCTRAKVIDVKSKGTLYPDIGFISDFSDLKSRRLYEAKYEFVLDLRDDLARLKVIVFDAEHSQKPLQQQFQECTDEIKRLAYDWHSAETEKLKKQLQDKESELGEKEEEFRLQTENLINSNRLLLVERDKMLLQLSQSYDEKKGRVMADNKGLYSLHWKHERPTWREAKCPIYFDVGEWLFVRHSGLIFRKVEIKKFMDQLLR